MAVRAVPITLNGREFQLRMDFGAMAALEDAGYEFDELGQFFATGRLSAKRLRAVLWAMSQDKILNENPPSIEELSRWVDGENLPDVIAKISEAWKLAFPKKGKESPPRKGVGTGVNSSALPASSP